MERRITEVRDSCRALAETATELINSFVMPTDLLTGQVLEAELPAKASLERGPQTTAAFVDPFPKWEESRSLWEKASAAASTTFVTSLARGLPR